MQTFKKHDQVLLKDSSSHYGRAEELPPNMIGMITDVIISNDLMITDVIISNDLMLGNTGEEVCEVSWLVDNNLNSNRYFASDLKPAIELIHPTLIFNQKDND